MLDGVTAMANPRFESSVEPPLWRNLERQRHGGFGELRLVEYRVGRPARQYAFRVAASFPNRNLLDPYVEVDVWAFSEPACRTPGSGVVARNRQQRIRGELPSQARQRARTERDVDRRS